MKVLIAEDSPAVARGVASVTRKGWLGSLLRSQEVPRRVLSVYYPYYFQSWKVTATRSFGREVRARLLTGVNGRSRSTGPASEWPSMAEEDLSGHEVIPPLTSEGEARELAWEYAERFVFRNYRPSKPPRIEAEEFALVYVPYHVYARQGQPLRKAALVEGFTGAVGKVKDVPEVFEVVAAVKAPATFFTNKEGQFR